MTARELQIRYPEAYEVLKLNKKEIGKKEFTVDVGIFEGAEELPQGVKKRRSRMMFHSRL
jgi:hypothetical protein